MTNEEIQAKWAATEQMLQVDYDKDFRNEGGLKLANAKCLVKCNLRGAITELRVLDYHDQDYKVPWSRKQFLWALSDPVGESKWKQAEQWKHECAAMTEKYRGVTV